MPSQMLVTCSYCYCTCFTDEETLAQELQARQCVPEHWEDLRLRRSTLACYLTQFFLLSGPHSPHRYNEGLVSMVSKGAFGSGEGQESKAWSCLAQCPWLSVGPGWAPSMAFCSVLFCGRSDYYWASTR